MPIYKAPLKDMHFVIYEMLEVEKIFQEIPKYKEVDKDTINQILEAGSQFSENVLFPINQIGDKEGCQRDNNGNVKTPKGFKEAYGQYIEAGWPALACDESIGGQGLPQLLNNALYEMMNSANQAWTMYPGLSHGAYECLFAHGTEEQKKKYLPNLVSGKWTGTMCLTEPHCGTDLGLLKTKAEIQPNGTYKITGTKIFISSGEHDLSENIVHLVLARVEGSPKGTKGISLFAVPKFNTDNNGNLLDRNNLVCGSIEHKMGIHGNATCVMNFDGAVGTLVGEVNKGLNAMFVMMNAARLGVGIQSLGLTEVAKQNSVAYAKDRTQMRSLTGVKSKEKEADPIIVHPDVRRMLLTQKAYAEGARAFAYWMALMIDIEHNHPDENKRKDAADLVALLTPVVKAFITDNAFISTNEGLQVFGGHGYIKEWGMEQFVRDARINMIYEGTNTIQSLDLLGRKVLGDMGGKLKKFGAIVESFIKEESENEKMSFFITPLIDIGEKIKKVTMEIGFKSMQNPDEVGAAAVPYLRLIGHFVYAYLFAQMASISLKKSNDDFYLSKIGTAKFYYEKILPETEVLLKVIKSGSGSLMSVKEEFFGF